MSSRIELPVDRAERPEMDCGLELYLGVGGWSSESGRSDGVGSSDIDGCCGRTLTRGGEAGVITGLA